MRSEWISKGDFEHVLAALYPENRLALEVSLATGLRINDVLGLKTAHVRKGRFTVREEKTGKTRRVRLPNELVGRCMATAGHHYVFEHRLNGRKHRTRQAVFKDLRRVAVLFKVKEHLSPHSARKVFAVEEYERTGGDLQRVKRLLNHSDEGVTMLYAMANVLNRRKNFLDKQKRVR